jgi:hypothetical protein
VYTLAAAAFTWPLALHPASLLGASDAAGDPALNLWTLGWDLHTISTHPSWLLTGRVFDAPIFFPARHALAFSDHLLAQAVALWPIYAFGGSPVLCYNILLMASLVASAAAMHALVRRINGDETAAYAAGVLFGFAPYHFTHLVHLQLQSLYWLPLTFLLLHRLRAGGRWRDAAALGVVFGLEILSSVYYGVIGGIGLAVAAVALAWLPGPRARFRFAGLALAAAVVALALALPWSLSYWRVSRESGAGRNLFEASHGSAVLASYVQAPPVNVVYGRTGWLRPSPDARLPRKDGPEQALFPGFCALTLALFGLVSAPRDLRVSSRTYAAIAIVGVALSLGPDGIRPVYAALSNGLFAMRAIRAPARFSVLTLCAIAVLAAVGVRALRERLNRARALVGPVVLSIVAIECFNGAIPYPAAPALTTDAGRWLKTQNDPGAVVCIPMAFDVANTPCMLQSLEHGHPIVNGYSGVTPPFFAPLADVTSRLPSVDALRALHDLGVRYIVSDRELPVDRQAADAVVERARFDRQRIYEIAWTPALEAAADAGADAVVPDPGPLPFDVGEQATYRVKWTSGPVDLPAGEITTFVAAPQGGDAFRFLVSGKTASWVSTFFVADATLATTATRQLFPVAHDETIVESGRRIERRLDFDRSAHLVRMTVAGGPPIAFPLPAGARDPITMLFYLRTLTLEPGLHLSLPLSDNGRQTRVDVTVAGEEEVTVGGRTVRAWRVQPRIRPSVERRAEPRMTAWVATDARRIPLAIEVDSDFGTARAELTSYRGR